jgi:hypothetical protein
MKGRVRLRMVARVMRRTAVAAAWLAVPMVWTLGAGVAVAWFDLQLIPPSPRMPSRTPAVLEQRARQPPPALKPKDKPIEYAPWEQVPT